MLPLTIGHYCPNFTAVNGKQFIWQARKWANANGYAATVGQSRCKGGHQTVGINGRRTVVKTGEIGT